MNYDVKVADNTSAQLEEWESDNQNIPQTVDEQIDILAAKTALAKEGVIDNLVNKKADELGAKSDVKVAFAHVAWAKAETEKIVAINDKSKAFFEANKQVLGIIGIKEQLGYKTMAMLFPIALTLFLIVAAIFIFHLAYVDMW